MAHPLPPIVDVEWVHAHPDAVVADVRWYLDGRSGADAYRGGHIPGAIFVDLDRDLAAHGLTPSAGRHPLPTPADFASAMSGLGIGDGDTIVAYDDSGGSTAARLVWMLRVLGRSAALLDGGLAAWHGPLSTEVTHRPLATFTAAPWSEGAVVSADAVAAATATPSAAAVLDARAPERYRGEVEPIDPRAGHIPGARNAPWAANLDPNGRFRSSAELRSLFVANGAGDGTIVYCGSGVTACHDALALEHAGFRDVRVFIGSWSAWSNDADRRVATGPE